MLKKLNNNKGFTIIEVMIVLAIAGLVILIVLLAVPALQRNGRNTAIKNDASAIAAAISTFASDNDGKSPKVATDIAQSTNGDEVTIGASTTAQAKAKIQAGTKVEPYVGGSPGTTVISEGVIQVRVKVNCAGTNSERAVAIWYSIETSGAPTAPKNNKCLEA